MGVFGNGYTNIRRIDTVAEATVELENELYSFNRLFEAVNVLNENSIILEFSFKDVIEKIKELWHKFTAWVKSIWDKIFHRNKIASKNVEEAKKNFDNAKQVVQQATPEQVKTVKEVAKPATEEKKEETSKADEKEEDQNKPKNIADVAKPAAKKLEEEKVPTTTVTKTDDKGNAQQVKVAPKVTVEDKVHVKVSMMTCNINYFLKYIEELDPTELIASMRIIGVQSIFKIKDEDLDKLDETIDWHIKDADRKLEEILDKVNSNHWLDVTEKILKDEDAGQATVQAAIKACDGFEGEIKKYTQLRDGIKEEKDDLLGELSSQEASLENPEIRNRLESNIREALKGQSDQEMVDKYINMYLNKIGPCFSRDIQRMQKLMPIYIKAEDACNKILDHYKNQYDSLTKLLVTPIK